MTEEANAPTIDEWMDAARAGDVVALQDMLNRGMAIDARSAQGRTALFCAASSGREEVVRVFLAAGAEVDAKSEAGWTPLMVAAFWDHKDIVTILLDAGADVLAADNEGMTIESIVPPCRLPDNFAALQESERMRRAAVAAEAERQDHLALLERQKKLRHRALKFKLKAGGPR